MTRRTELLEFAVLGLLHESPLHRVRAAQAGSTPRSAPSGRCPMARSTRACAGWSKGLIRESIDGRARRTRRAGSPTSSPRTARNASSPLVSRCEPSSWEDEEFDVHLAFFARTESQVRLRILEGRRSRSRSASLRSGPPGPATASAPTPTPPRSTSAGWTPVEREVRWLDEPHHRRA